MIRGFGRGLVRVRLGLLAISLAFLLTIAACQPAAYAGSFEYRQFQKGMTYVGSNDTNQTTCESEEQQSLEALAATGINWIAITVAWYQDTYTSSSIQPDPNRTPTDASLIHLIQTIHRLGMRIMLKLHIASRDGIWSAKIGPKDVGAWFESYRGFVNHYAELAQASNVEILCIGTELDSMTQSSLIALWLGIIEDVRGVFANELTYAANWQPRSGVWHDLRFWKELDYVGIDAYFTLTEKDDPTVSELKEAWQKWVPQIEDWQNLTRKQMIFTEIGYRNQAGTNRNPGTEWRPGGPSDQQEQANAYEAALEMFWGKPWLRGMFFFAWGPYSRIRPTDYTPWGRLAETVLRTWYAKPFIPDGTPSDAVPALVGIQEAEGAVGRAHREERTVGLDSAENTLSAAINAYRRSAIVESEILATIAKKLADSAVKQQMFVEAEKLGLAFVLGVGVGVLCLARRFRARIRRLLHKNAVGDVATLSNSSTDGIGAYPIIIIGRLIDTLTMATLAVEARRVSTVRDVPFVMGRRDSDYTRSATSVTPAFLTEPLLALGWSA